MKKLGYKSSTNLAHFFIYLFVGLICLIWLVPLMMIFSSSFTEEAVLVNKGYTLFPTPISLEAYRWLWRDPSMLVDSYKVSTAVTVLGTFLSLIIMAMLAYPLSRKTFKLRGVMTFFVFFTMLFNGGLVPYYINMTRVLGLKNSIWSMILPYLVMPFYVLLLRTFFAGLPKDLFDAARIDGASEFRIFFQIVLPLSLPALSTIGMFSLLQYWNDMYQALLFIESPHLYPLQFTLYKLIVNTQMLSDLAVQTGSPVPHLSVRMAMAVIAIGPVILAFLFVQKYFVRGITLGSIKGD